MQRFGAVVRLRPERRAEYLALHAAVWPDVEAMLTRANIRNYTIFRHDDLLFGYYEYIGDDYPSDQARIAADPATQQWWRVTEPCQRRLPDNPTDSLGHHVGGVASRLTTADCPHHREVEE